ncbi:MAG: DUF1836 domain-containing protein [Lachnospiraceae bacterium]|nr:DUF1836 domain-containing protein [Lachnospiraceae bacterium]MBQ7777129.1 DUF1836 domain-containing protein [Lachnospiraceae bacterium]
MQEIRKEIAESIKDFKLPEYEAIPNVGLYLEQVTKYIADYMAPLESIAITSSMIGNYVKKGLIANPVKKQYYREQIAYLIFIAVAKSVLSLEDIQLLIEMKMKKYDSKTAYTYFCMELENVLHYVFGLKGSMDEIGKSKNDTKIMLRNTIVTVAHKIYLDKYFARYKEEIEEEQ